MSTKAKCIRCSIESARGYTSLALEGLLEELMIKSKMPITKDLLVKNGFRMKDTEEFSCVECWLPLPIGEVIIQFYPHSVSVNVARRTGSRAWGSAWGGSLMLRKSVISVAELEDILDMCNMDIELKV